MDESTPGHVVSPPGSRAILSGRGNADRGDARSGPTRCQGPVRGSMQTVVPRGTRSGARCANGCYHPAMLDHEEKFLFKEEILHLANAVAEPGALDNVEDLLTDVITSPRFDSEVFTLERSLQVMLGPRAGTTLVGLLTVAPEVFDEVAEVRIPSEVHERLVAWRARFGLAIDNALNFLNNPDGIQGHNFATQIAHVEERRVLQGRLTLVRYNNEPQFFVADAGVFLGLVADVMERLGPVPRAGRGRRRDAEPAPRRDRPDRAQDDRRWPASRLGEHAESRADAQLYLAATGQNRGKTTAALGLLDGFVRRGLRTGFIKPVGQRTVIEDGEPADEDAVLMKEMFGLPESLPGHEPGPHPARLHEGVHRGRGRRGPRRRRSGGPRRVRRPRDAAGRGHGPRRRRRGHRPLERGGRRHARARRRSSSARAASAGRSTRSSSTPRCSGRTASRSRGRSSTRSTSTPQPGIARALERGLARHGIPLLGVLPVPADPLEPDARDDPRGRPRRDDPPRPGPRPGHRRRRDRGDGGRPHARAGRAGHAGHRPGRPRGRDPDADDRPLRAPPPSGRAPPRRPDRRGRRRRHERGRRIGRGPRGRGGRAGADRRLPAAPVGARCDPRGGHLRDARQGGHLRRRVGGPRPAGEDPRRRPREDRDDQGARRGAPSIDRPDVA